LIRDSAGNLYGTTQGGGTSGRCVPSGCGVVFKLDPGGKETVLYSFSGGADGAFPAASLVRDSSGNFYGTASAGGVSCVSSGTGCGVVFKLDASTGKQTVIHAFTGNADGSSPGNLFIDKAGILYGITTLGGASGGCGGGGCGVIFALDPITAKETVLYTFTGGADGGEPSAGLIQDPEGNLYGTAGLGGISGGCGIGCGVVFKLDPISEKETVLYTFMGGSDGGVPVAGLIQDSAGNFYGTTEYRGTFDWGVVFKLDVNGKESVLHGFTGGVDGATPRAGLIQDAASNLYGTALQGGTGTFFTNGVIFKLNRSGTYSVLHAFSATGTEGVNPEAGLILDSAGNLYGTTSGGGLGYGVVFKLAAAAPTLNASLSPASLSFGDQALGTPSPAKRVIVKNTGTTTLTIAGIAITGTNARDFVQTHNCGSSLAAGASCSINVTFKPTASGTRTAALSVRDNAAGSPQKVSLTGVGTTAKLFPTSLNFGTVAIGTRIAKAVTLTNVSMNTLALSGIAITGTNTGDFVQTHNCGSSLAAGASCSINVTFKPTASGTRTGSLSVSDSAAGSPQKVSLSGVGAAAKLSPTSLNFGSVGLGTTSLAKTVILKNVGTITLHITSILITGTDTGDFAQRNNCLTLLLAGASCTLTVTFRPAALGNRTASLRISDGAAGSPQTVPLSGIGVQGGTLTGYCVHGFFDPHLGCGITSDPSQCPTGKLAISPVTLACGRPGQGPFYVDEARSCRVVINGQSFGGSCQRTP
jgi:uncharacterized repeat protein (TIGR03803 family)